MKRITRGFPCTSSMAKKSLSDMRISASSEAGADRPNEDHFAISQDMVVVLDGATARTETGCVHGVAWYARYLADAVIGHPDLPPEGALARAIVQTADQHRTCDLEHPGTPSAAVAIVQAQSDVLRYLVLGDVTVVADTRHGLQVVSDDRVSKTALAERAIADALPNGSPQKAEALVRMKHAELAARNVPGGFWVATGETTEYPRGPSSRGRSDQAKAQPKPPSAKSGKRPPCGSMPMARSAAASIPRREEPWCTWPHSRPSSTARSR